MESSVPNSPGVHLVHLVPNLSPDAAPPAELLFPPRLGPAGRTIVACVFAVATIICGWLVAILWTSETPGWWFNAIFTVMLAGLAAGVWGGFAATGRDAARERAAKSQWNWIRATVRPVRGTVASRHVGLSEDGGVSSFSLTIRTGEPGIASFDAEWKPPARSPDLLQSQVPGIGAEARVWVPGQSHTGQALFVVEVADPTVALDRRP